MERDEREATIEAREVRRKESGPLWNAAASEEGKNVPSTVAEEERRYKAVREEEED